MKDYFCEKCKKIHRFNSDIGKKHSEFQRKYNIDEMLKLPDVIDDLFIRFTVTIEDIKKKSIETYDRLDFYYDIEKIAFTMYRDGFLPEYIQKEFLDDPRAGVPYEAEDFVENLIELADKGDLDSQRVLLEYYLKSMSNSNIYHDYEAGERILDGKKRITIEARGSNVTKSAGEGVPIFLVFVAWVKGRKYGENIEKDGILLDIKEILTIYNEVTHKFVKIDHYYFDKFLKSNLL